MEEIEIWKDVVGFEGAYEVSNLGRVRSPKKESKSKRKDRKVLIDSKYLKLSLNSKGYISVALYKKGEKSITTGVHRLVCLAFLKNPENKPLVNHKDGVKTNNHLSNLEWNTYSENTKHAYDNNLTDVKKRSGENSRCAILTGSEVILMREYYRHSIFSQSKLAKIFNVSLGNVHSIVNYNTWKEYKYCFDSLVWDSYKTTSSTTTSFPGVKKPQ